MTEYTIEHSPTNHLDSHGDISRTSGKPWWVKLITNRNKRSRKTTAPKSGVCKTLALNSQTGKDNGEAVRPLRCSSDYYSLPQSDKGDRSWIPTILWLWERHAFNVYLGFGDGTMWQLWHKQSPFNEADIPKFLTNQTVYYSWEGNPVNISCDVTSNPPATMLWRREPFTISADGTANMRVYSAVGKSVLEVGTSPETKGNVGAVLTTGVIIYDMV